MSLESKVDMKLADVVSHKLSNHDLSQIVLLSKARCRLDSLQLKRRQAVSLLHGVLQRHRNTMVRDIDRIDPLPDEKLKQQDKAYLERHKLDKLFGNILNGIVSQKPPDPIQYIIDWINLGEAAAQQDHTTGLPEHRKAKLLDVFRVIDKERSGHISLKHLQSYTSRYGGESLTATELRSIFEDFRAGSDTEVGVPEFLIFFAKVSKTIPNKAFDDMIKDLLA